MILSIIVPVYNVEKYLERCIDSLIEQDIDVNDYEIIMVNDGSTDNSKTIAEQLVEKYQIVSLYNQENRGLAGARNTGLRKAKGKYVMFVDSDDYLMPNILSFMLEKAEKYQLDILEARMKVMKEDGHFIEGLIQPFNPDIVITGEYALLHGVNIASVCGMLYSSLFLNSNQIRFTEGMTHEDVDFNTRCYPLANRILFSDVISYVYFWNYESLNRNQNINMIKKAIIDDIIIAANTRKYVRQFNYPEDIKMLYEKRSNSIIISVLLKLMNDKKIPVELIKECFYNIRFYCLYPIKGKTLSWKTTLLTPFINTPLFEKYLLRR